MKNIPQRTLVHDFAMIRQVILFMLI